MGDLLGGLFGGSSSTSDPQVMSLSTMTPAQQQLLSKITGILNSQVGQGVTPYSGQLAAGSSSTQQSQYDFIQQLLSGSGGNNTMSALQDILKPYDSSSTEKYWQNSLVAPAMNTWNKETLPSILEQFAGSGSLNSSGAMRAVANAGATLNTNLSAQLEDALYKSQQADTTNKLSAMGYENNLISSLNTPGATEQATEQNALTSEYQRWASGQSYNNPWLQYLFNDLGTKAFENVVIPGTTTQTGGVNLGGILSGIGSLASVFF